MLPSVPSLYFIKITPTNFHPNVLICNKALTNFVHLRTFQKLQNKMFSYMQHKSKCSCLSYPYHHELTTHAYSHIHTHHHTTSIRCTLIIHTNIYQSFTVTFFRHILSLKGVALLITNQLQANVESKSSTLSWYKKEITIFALKRWQYRH